MSLQRCCAESMCLGQAECFITWFYFKPGNECTLSHGQITVCLLCCAAPWFMSSDFGSLEPIEVSLHCLFCDCPRKVYKLLVVPVSGFGPEGPGLTAVSLLTWAMYVFKDRKQDPGARVVTCVATYIVLRQQWPLLWCQVGLGLVGAMGFSAVHKPLQWHRRFGEGGDILWWLLYRVCDLLGSAMTGSVR